MATVKTTYATGGAQLTPGAAGSPSLATVLRDLADDLQLLGGRFNSLHAKLDADVGVTDTDYASTLDVNLTTDLKHQKG
jgi:hypothetical protein